MNNILKESKLHITIKNDKTESKSDKKINSPSMKDAYKKQIDLDIIKDKNISESILYK